MYRCFVLILFIRLVLTTYPTARNHRKLLLLQYQVSLKCVCKFFDLSYVTYMYEMLLKITVFQSELKVWSKTESHKHMST